MAFTGIFGIEGSQPGSLEPGLSGSEPPAQVASAGGSYGQGEFAKTPYAGVSLESAALPVLASISPAANSQGSPVDVVLTFTITCPIDLDPYSLSVTINGELVILASGWLPAAYGQPYGGSISISGSTGTVSIGRTRPYPSKTEVDVEISIRNLAGDLSTFTHTFWVGYVTLDVNDTLVFAEEGLTLVDAEGYLTSGNLTLSESFTLAPNYKGSVSDTLSITEFLQARSFSVQYVDSTTFRVFLPDLFQIEGAADLLNYELEALDGGASIRIKSLELEFEPVASGSGGRVVPAAKEFGVASFQTVGGVSTLTDSAAKFTRTVVVGDTVEVETLVNGRLEYTVVQILSDAELEVEPGTGSASTYYRINDNPAKATRLVQRTSFPMSLFHMGDYLGLTSPSGVNSHPSLRIVEQLNPYTARVDSPLLPHPESVTWAQRSGVASVLFRVTEGTQGKHYRLTVRNLRTKSTGTYFSGSVGFVAEATKPKVGAVSSLPDGTVLVDFDEPMRFDEALSSPEEYGITGPTSVSIQQVVPLSATQLALKTAGLASGSYTLTVNASGTPKDVAGNPIDPVFNTAVFTASTPLLVRSIFTDKGPIAKPAKTILSGSGVTLHTYTSPIFGTSLSFTSDEVTFTGGAFTSDHVGLTLQLAGTEKNDGVYKVLGLVGTAPTARVRLQANFRLPDGNNGSGSWDLIDPRDGQIADDPTDVTVRVNGVQVTPEAVIGLLGQVVLPTTPTPTDEVKVDYAWVQNPVVDFRRLNSREFVLNNWAYDAGHTASPSQHQYRYRNILATPDNYAIGDISSPLAAPQLRQVHYRAFERAYSALLNDPALLLLNTPKHRISYAPLSRQVSEVSVSYDGNILPEEGLTNPWQKKGSGLASVAGGVLRVDDNTTGPFPEGNPLFWQREVDLSFDHVFAATWRMTILSVTALEGVSTGVAVGWSNDKRVVVLGYLNDSGVKKLGFLKRGSGNTFSESSAWGGALDSFGSPTHESAEFDWSILHSYRFLRNREGVIRLFVDGELQELLRVTEDELPYLEELNTPFSEVQGVFFGSLSRPAKTVSTWDFIRYLVLPTNPEQTQPSIFVSYEGGVVPEVATSPWTPIGYHGNEQVSTGGRLLLSSTSATDKTIESDVGLVGGDFRGYTRIEPLLSNSSDVVIDTQFRVLSYTHGITPNAVMVAVDDGNRLVQLSAFPYKSQPKVSYPGRSFPEDAAPLAWSKVGSESAEMIGRTLRLTDTSSNGVAYRVYDTAVADSLERVLGSLSSYTIEFQLKVVSFEADPSGYCGATASVYDELRSVGLQLKRSVASTPLVSGSGVPSGLTWVDSTKNFTLLGVLPGDELSVGANTYAILGVSTTTLTLNFPVPISGAYTVRQTTRRVEFHSNGQSLSPAVAFDFDWYDSKEHTYRLVKSATDGTVIQSGFLGALTHFNIGTGTSRFTDSAATLISVQVGDHIVVKSGLSTGSYPVTALVSATTVEVNGLPVQSTGVIWEVQRNRNATVVLFIDDVFVGSVDYAKFITSAGSSPFAWFGSTMVEADSRSVTDWAYCNVWRVEEPAYRYVGIWKGFDEDKLTGYYLPTKAIGEARVTSTMLATTYLNDATASFVTAGVANGDHFLVDEGPNKGDYEVVSVSTTQLGVKPAMSVVPTDIRYRVAKTVDWSVDHRYRIIRDPAGAVALFLDAESVPQISIPYSEVALPASSVGLPHQFQSRIPSVSWGAFDPANLSQTDWAYVRYGIVQSPTEDRKVPPHQVLNQRNVMSSPEHLKGSVAHEHTQYSTSSTGVPYPWKEYSENTLVEAFTQLNEGTPIVPLTQTYEVRRPTPVLKPVSALNNPSDVLNSDRDFLLNDATMRVELAVPNDVLYNSLEVVEKETGELGLLAPFTDSGVRSIGPISYTKETCLLYDGEVLPENDVSASTPWVLTSDPLASYTASAFNGELTYGVSGGQTLYRNNTPLTDPAGLDTEVSFKFEVVEDATTGTGDSGIRVGFSAFGLTVALAFITSPLGDREVRLLDLNANEVLGSILFDYLDGASHIYRLKKNVSAGAIEFSID